MLTEEIKSIKSTREDLRKFGITVGTAAIVLGGIFFWLEKEFYIYFVSAGILLFLLGLIIPDFLKPLQKTWMTVAVIIGWYMTRLILGILYYFVFTTIGLIAKLFGKQFLELKWNRQQETYWNQRKIKKVDKSEYEKQF
jgi:hypothetical protein